jgi:oxalate decarboxylase/phosphoglucose isomerase-like protein (cupin superfamily)
VESLHHVPFEVQRVFFIYDVPTGESRGGHAHKELHEFIICLSGSFDVQLDDGEDKRTIHLNRPWKGLHVPPMVWAAETNFDTGSVCLVLASAPYDEADYLYDYDEYLTKTMHARRGETPA